MAKFKLEIEDDYGFEVFAISSHVNNYRLAWGLNKYLNWNLIRKSDVVIKSGSAQSEFSLFEFDYEEESMFISLLNNASDSGFLLPEYQQFDFILKIEGLEHNPDNHIHSGLRKIPFIQTFVNLDIDSIKSKHNLLYVVEPEKKDALTEKILLKIRR